MSAESVFEIVFHEDQQDWDEMFSGLYEDCGRMYADMFAKWDDISVKCMGENEFLDIMDVDDYWVVYEEINNWNEENGNYAWETEEIMTCYDTMKHYYTKVFMPMINVYIIKWVGKMAKDPTMNADKLIAKLDVYLAVC
jgi:hypothetical protein